jgi:hypothetical protein
MEKGIYITRVPAISTTQEAYIKSNHNRMTIAEMARGLKVSNTYVSQWMTDLGIEKRKARGPKKVENEVNNTGFFVHDANIVTI